MTRLNTKKGQTFAIDLALGVMIMTGTLMSIILFLPDPDPPFQHDQERLQVLMTEGVPLNWNNDTVIMLGFLSDDRFNMTKIETFANMTLARQRSLLGIRSDFTIRFSYNNTSLPICNTCGLAPANYKHVLPVRRTALNGSNIFTMEVLLYS